MVEGMALPAPASPQDLTVPRAGAGTARAVFSLALRKAFEDLKALRAPAGTSATALEDYRRTREALVALLPGKPGIIASMLRRPTVSAPLRCLRDGRGDPNVVLAEVCGQIAFELALSGALVGELELRHLPERLVSLGWRRAIDVPAGAKSAIFEAGTVSFDGVPVELGGDGPGARFVEINEHAVLALVDNNPQSMFEAHPDKEGNAIDLGGKSAEAWVASLSESFATVERHMPALREEMQLFVQQIVPVGYDGEKHLSASYQESIGTIYMTLHPQQMTMTEALIHEFSHNKINALFELDPLLHNAFHPLFKSPVRPDPRPLHGVLLAVHAFLPVAKLYEKMVESDEAIARRPDFLERFAQIRRTNREGCEIVLANAEPTEAGQGVFDEIRRLDAHFRAFD